MIKPFLVCTAVSIFTLASYGNSPAAPIKPTGVEIDQPATVETQAPRQGTQTIEVHSPHLLLTQVVLRDATDHTNELVQEKQWLLHPREQDLKLSGNLFLVEDLLNKSGTIFIKSAPLPNARPTKSDYDLKVKQSGPSGYAFTLNADEPDATWSILEYTGGPIERARALQSWQLAQRPDTDGHTTSRFLSNTWGDRSRDGRMQETFILGEIDAAEQLGVDVVQLDDGWQEGVTANSKHAAEHGGVWEGFWKTDPDFWTVNKERFPHGLEGIVAYAKEKDIRIGLWYAPDSWNHFANWQKDADKILELHNTYGVDHFKVDSINFTSETGRKNLHAFFDRVLAESKGEVVFDLDITAGTRPGYLGAIEVGPLFVENRYTDWQSYWPHQTLRNLWKLSHWIAPQRLRMEFLNNTRNTWKYPKDPLAPKRYSPDTLFATVMFSNPLGWFECSGLPKSYIQSVAPLVATWKQHREELFKGTILPIGDEPDGFSPTGFLSVSPDANSGYLLAFRELNPESTFSIEIPEGLNLENSQWEVLHAEGSVSVEDGAFIIKIPDSLGFIFARFSAN